MRATVAIIYNEPRPTPPDEHWLSRSAGDQAVGPDFRDASEYGVLDQIREIEEAIRAAGHQTRLFSADDPAILVTFLDRERPDVVFNCCESFRGTAALEMNVAALFELFDIPFTGSSALTLGLALNKGVAKALFRAHDIPTPPSVVLASTNGLEAARPLGFPLIVKPMAEDASIGIDTYAVVHDDAALANRVRFILEEFTQPALVEEFIEGRELNVSLLAISGDEFVTLPIAEIPFDRLPAGSPAIVSYEAKWVKESPLYGATMAICPSVLAPALEDRVRQLALKAARAVGLRDYGRIDMRLRTRDGALFVLEANPNPDLFDEAGFMRAAEVSGRTVTSTVQHILARALERAHAAGR